MKRFIINTLMFFSCVCIYAQHELPDTLSVKINNPIKPNMIGATDSINASSSLYEFGEKFNEYQDSIGKLSTPNIYYPGFYPGQAQIVGWNSGALTAAGQREVMPGMLGRESGILNVYQTLDKFTFTAYGSATKLAYFRGLTTQWGFGGSITYQYNDNLSFTAYGSYASKARVPLSLEGVPNFGILGYAEYPAFGGYANYRFGSSRFGIKAGAQSYYNLGSKHWETQPMLMPYYKANNGAELGIDVGGILYNLLKSGNNFKASNPTIAPPKLGPPPVR